MKLKIDKEFHNLIPPLNVDEYGLLEKSIKKEGVRDPLVIWNDIILDGHNRFRICNKYKIKFKTKEIKFKDKIEAKLWIINNQLARRNLSDYSRILLESKKEDILQIKKKAKEQSGKRTDLSLETKERLEPLETAKEVAKKAKVSKDKVYKARFIEKKADDKTKEKLSKGEESINKIYTEMKRKEKEEQREEERKKDEGKIKKVKSPEELFKNIKFSTIVIDPPWDVGDEKDVDQFGRARPTYKTMPIEEIEKLPVDKLSKKDAHIYLWITNRSLPKGFNLLEKWGFRYITCLTWCKPSIGMGNYFRGSSEQVLFGVKGSLPLKKKNVGTWFSAKRPDKKHSSKPDEFYKMVESCSHGLYLDMFGRKKRKGWYIWGSENGN